MIITINDQVAKLSKIDLITKSINLYEVEFQFDASWNNYTKTAVFKCDGNIYDVLLNNNKCLVPTEVLQNAGAYLYVGVYGTLNGVRKPTIYTEPIRLIEGAYGGTGATPPTPTIYAQLSEALNKAVRTDIDQTFTAEEKAKALANLGLTIDSNGFVKF